MADNLKERTAKGLLWGTINNGTAQVLNLVIGIFLARKLDATDYGIVGVLAIFGAIASSLQNCGLAPALINIKTPTHKDYNAVFWMNLSISMGLYVILFLSAPLIAAFFHQPCLVSVSRYMFLGLPIQALSIASGAYLMKNMMNREIAIIGIVSLALSGAVGILMAYQGFSYWSLVAQQLINVTCITLGRFYYVPWMPSLHIDLTPVKQMLGFSVKLMITSIVNALNFHVLTFVFGRFLPIQAVGYYAQANKWNNMAKTTISDAIGQVAQTVMVSVSDERDRDIRVFRKLMRFTAFLSFPALLGLALVSREFIILTIGEKWMDSILLLQILCIGGAFLPFYTLYQNLAISHGRSDIYMWYNIGQIVIQLAIVLLLYKLGIVAIVCASSAFIVLWLVAWHLVGYRLIGLRFIHLLMDTLPFLFVALAVMAATYVITMRIENLALLLALHILIAAVLYVGAMKLLQAKVMEETLQFLFKKKVSK